MYRKEACYLSVYGKTFMNIFILKGIDEDLALEILHLTVPEEKLYDLDEV